MRLLFTILFLVLSQIVFCQNKRQGNGLNDRAVKSSQQYFDINDPYFLAFFINAQEKGNKKKLFDSLIRTSPSYNKIPSNMMDDFVDSIREAIFKDTGKVCVSSGASIKAQNVFLPKSNYIFWINYKCFYKVGYHKKNTEEFAEEFLDPTKIKSIAIVTPPQTHNNCIGKTVAHIYIFTKRKVKPNYTVANCKLKQLQIGKKWIGHN